MLAALRSAVASVSSELAEKNAVIRILAEHGHRRQPRVVSQRDASGVTRVYVWEDAGIALVTGPSLQGTVYEVRAVPAGVDPTAFDLFIPGERGRTAYASGGAKRAAVTPAPRTAPRAAPARTPLAQAPRRIGAVPAPQPPTRAPARLTRHNPPAPVVLPLSPLYKPPPPSPLPAEGIGVSFSTDRFRALPPNPVWVDGGGTAWIAGRLKPYEAKPGGGMSGGVFIDPKTGLKYLVKHMGGYGLTDMLPGEVIAAQLYRALGIFAPDMRIGSVDVPGFKGTTPCVISPWVDGLKKFATSVSGWNANVPALEKKWMAASLPADVWLANYDVVGLEWDNLLSLPDGHAIRIDPGASTFFRAGGKDKSPLPTTNAATELDTMLFKPLGDKIQHVFADAATDPAIMLPMAEAIATYMTPAYLNALVDWATSTFGSSFPKYLLKLGLSGKTMGDYLYERGQSLLAAIQAKASAAAPAPKPVASSVSAGEFNALTLANAVAPLVGGKAIPSGIYKNVAHVDIDKELLRGTIQKVSGFAAMQVFVDGESKGTTSFAIPTPVTQAFYATTALEFAAAIKAATGTAAAPPPATPMSFADEGDEDEWEEDEDEGYDTSHLPTMNSVTLLSSAPLGTVVCDDDGGTFYYKDETGLWRRLTENGMMTPGSFASGLFNLLAPKPIRRLVLGDDEAIAPSDKAVLKELWLQADAALSGDAVPAAPAPVAAPAPTTPKPWTWPVDDTPAPDELPTPAPSDVAEALSTLLNKHAHEQTGAKGQPAFQVAQIGQSDLVVANASGSNVARLRVDVTEDEDNDDELVLLGRELTPELGEWATLLWNGASSAQVMAKAMLPAAVQFITSVVAKTTAPVAAPTPIAAPVATPATPVPLGDIPGFTPFAYSLPLDPVWDTVGDWYTFLLRIGKAPMGTKLGSFPGGKVTDPQTGASFYIKAFDVGEHARTEALACRLYRLLGINAPDVRIINDGAMLGSKHKFTAKTLTISPWQDGYQQVMGGKWTTTEKAELASQFAADAWMANYDVVGKGPGTPWDNLLMNIAYAPLDPLHYLRVDQGAALDYRSTGSTKKSSNDWGPNAAWTFKNFLSSAHPTLQTVFGGATYANNAKTISRIANLMLANNIINVFEAFARDDLFDTLMERAMALSNAQQKAGAGVVTSSPSIPSVTASGVPTAAQKQAEMAVSLLVSALSTQGWQTYAASPTQFTVTAYTIQGVAAPRTFEVAVAHGKLQLRRVYPSGSVEVLGALPLNASNIDPLLPPILAFLDGLKQSSPQAAAPAAGTVAVGSLLTTVEAIDALPTYSVIGLGYQVPNGSFKARVFVRNALGTWDGKNFSGSPDALEPAAAQNLLPSEKDWAAVVLRVGDVGPGLAALLAPVVAAHNIDPTAAYYPLGA